MEIYIAYLANIFIYSLFPFFIMSIHAQTKEYLLYAYISTIFLWGALANGIYSFLLFDTIKITGGSIAYGAFMMNTVILIILERKTTTFFNLFRLVFYVDIVIFIIFSFLKFAIKNNLVINTLNISYKLFDISIWILIIGGTLILLEIFILLAMFLYLRNKVSDVYSLSIIYTFTFILIICFDGILFSIFEIVFSENFFMSVYENTLSKFVLAISYGIPMFLFFLLFKNIIVKFSQTPLFIENMINFRKEILINKIYKYELRYQEQQNEMKKLIELTDIDPLTSLANKRKFETAFDGEWSKCLKEKQYLTIAIADVDFFKQYNDTYGHLQGDICLKTIATLWRDIGKKPSDVAARIGGEEFAIISPCTSPEQMYPSLADFLEKLKEKHVAHESSRVADYVTVSIGVAGCIPEEGSNPLRLFDAADKKLYMAKEKGRNNIVSD